MIPSIVLNGEQSFFIFSLQEMSGLQGHWPKSGFVFVTDLVELKSGILGRICTVILMLLDKDELIDSFILRQRNTI